MTHGYLGGLHRGHAVLCLRHDERGVSPARGRLRPDGLHVRREYVLDVGYGSVILQTEILRHQLRHRHLSDDPRCHDRPQILAMSQVGSGSYLGAFWAFGAIAVASLAVSLFIKPPKVRAQPVEQCAVGPTFLRRPRTVDAFLCSRIMER